MGLSSQSFTSWCPTQSYKRCTNWRINLFHFCPFNFRRCMGCLCFTWSFKLWWYSKEVTTLSAWSENYEIVLLLTAPLRITDSSSWESSCMDPGSCCGIWVSSKYLDPLPNWTLRERVLPASGKSAKLPAPDPSSADPTSWMVALVCG